MNHRQAPATPFVLPVFLAAFLLFQIQPLIGRYILPWFGGASSVWTTSLLFFQGFLLLGYVYAHLFATRLPLAAQVWLHIGLLGVSLVLLPVVPSEVWKPSPDDAPIPRILVLLTATIGLPYLLLASTSPLLQRWFSYGQRARSPYRLYALSNAASLLALVTYPFVIEPLLSVERQVVVWSVLYAGFVASLGWPAARVVALARGQTAGGKPGRTKRNPRDADVALPRPAVVLLWLVLPAAGSAMLLATTNQLTQEVASFPFLWVLPLALYLLTFMICFERERWYDRRVFAPALAVTAVLAVAVLVSGSLTPLAVQLAVFSGALFACCMSVHGELARLKPPPRHLTLFYLMIALGGALGGAFVALGAPILFRGYWEFHVALAGCCGLTLFVATRGRDATPRADTLLAGYVVAVATLVVLGVVAVALAKGPGVFLPGWGELRSTIHAATGYHRYLFLAGVGVAMIALAALLDHRRNRRGLPAVRYRDALWAVQLGLVLALGFQATTIQGHLLQAERSFYGVLRVEERRGAPLGANRVLRHGSILHGEQFVPPAERRRPTSYYGPASGVGLALLHHPYRRAPQAERRPLRVGVIGLGVGTLAAYGAAGDVFRFYEINPGVIRLSEEYFTYRGDSPAEVQVVLGDARLQLAGELARGEPQRFDLLVVDAFSSDAIPVHLLTVECVELYRRHLAPGGLLLFHISNHFLDLRPLARGLAAHFGLRAVFVESGDDDQLGTSAATWAILAAADVADALGAAVSAAAEPDGGERTAVLWTDRYSSLWPLLRW